MTAAPLTDAPMTDGADLLARLRQGLAGPRPLRLATPDGFRLLVDRDLPFMCVARSDDGRRRPRPETARDPLQEPVGDARQEARKEASREALPDLPPRPRPPSLAARVASAGAVHALWVRHGAGDDRPERVVRAIADAMQARFATGLLVIEIRDLDDPIGVVPGSEDTAPFEIEVAVAGLPPRTDALATLGQALGRIRIDDRRPTVRIIDDTGAVGRLRGALYGGGPLDGIARLSIGLPAIHLAADRSRFYPELLHRMETAVIDAVLRCAWTYARAVLEPAPGARLVAGRHHRALGRRALDAAARTVDRQLTAIASAYELLLELTPINSAEAEADFRRSGEVAPPTFRYRPLAISPGELKRALFSISIGRVEDPVLEDLFYEKQREIDQQLTLLQLRGSSRFRDASRVLYGSVGNGLLATARSIIDELRQRIETERRAGAAPPPPMVEATMIRAAAEAVIARYRAFWPGFEAVVQLRDDLPAGLMVSGPRLLISSRTRMRAIRLPALLEHEIGVHLLTYFNGDAQGLRIFRSGLAGYERIQEGLAVLAEFATGGTGIERLRLIAARVVAVHAMQSGASFVETVRLLSTEVGLDGTEAFHVALRVHRSGGLSKDAIYLQGLQQVLQHLAGGGDLEPLWLGKIAAHHIGVVQELVARGMLSAAHLRPAFLDDERGQAFLRHAASGPRLLDLLNEEPTA